MVNTCTKGRPCGWTLPNARLMADSHTWHGAARHWSPEPRSTITAPSHHPIRTPSTLPNEVGLDKLFPYISKRTPQRQLSVHFPSLYRLIGVLILFRLSPTIVPFGASTSTGVHHEFVANSCVVPSTTAQSTRPKRTIEYKRRGTGYKGRTAKSQQKAATIFLP